MDAERPAATNRGRLIRRIAVVSFLGIIAFGTVVALRLQRAGRQSETETVSAAGAVTDKYQPYKGKTDYWVVRLSDGTSLVPRSSLVSLISPGDSIYKKKGEAFYTLRKKEGGASIQLDVR